MKKRWILWLTGLLLCGCTTSQQAVSPDAPLLDRVNYSYQLAENWLLDNMRDKGLFHYIYYPEKEEYPTSNNAIRQLMAARLLAELSHDRPELMPMHEDNMQFFMKYWYKEENGLGYVYYDDKAKLGANAMLLRTIVWSPDFETYKDQAVKLAEGILSMMSEEGAFHSFFKEPDYEYDDEYLLTFYSGEALLALVEYYQKIGDEKYLEAAIKSQEYYIEKYVTHMAENYYPAYVPWHTLSLNMLWKITGDQHYADAIFVLNDELLKIQDTTNEIGRFFNPAFPQYGQPHSSSDGVYTEGLAYAYEIALLTQDEVHQKKYLQAIDIAVNNLIRLQYDSKSAAAFKKPERIIGALRINKDQTGIRIDTVQHTMDAYRKLQSILTGQSS